MTEDKLWCTPNIDQAFIKAKMTPTDIQHHCEKLMELALECDVIVEFGTRFGVSTVSFLAGRPKALISYDLKYQPQHDEINTMCPTSSNWIIIYGNIKKTTFKNPPPSCDMMFFDSEHSYDQLSFELKWAHKSKRYLVFHDTSTFWYKNPMTGQIGIGPAIEEFLTEYKGEWELYYETSACNGLMIYKRIK